MIIELTIQGLVQGVGFRPFIYLLAQRLGIKGTISNRNNGVIVRAVFKSEEQKIAFIDSIYKEAPHVASIFKIEEKEIDDDIIYSGFSIISSDSLSDEVTQVAPDIAVCTDCLNDRKTQPHRIGYPFVNCTHCGPRFTIIKDLPYDRVQTTMSEFDMCLECEKEYRDITDRRFHAQPVACNNCGPVYYADFENRTISDYRELLDLSSRFIREGRIIAVKGIGGYHLICDATNETAVNKLREIKIRDSKPFAVMFKDVETLKEYTDINDIEIKNITSWRRPIVLLKQKKQPAESVNRGMKTLGCMLPYMPIHYDWFEKIDTCVLVMTSGNISDTPIIISPEEAEKELGDKVDLILHHNREIHNRADDSVLQVCGGQVCLIRRSRGYVPEPFFADIRTEGILAFGAEKVNTFALGKGDTIVQSQYISDLKNWETYNFYTESLERFRRLFRFRPEYLVCDLHPDYLSTKAAEQFAVENNLPLIKVQHHHAHAAACMVEYGIHEPVIAVVWDGTGLGDDNKAWGGEFFLCDRNRYERLSHFEYVPMPGGDKASLEPWRMAVSYLYHYNREIPDRLIKRIGKDRIDLLIGMIDRKINCPDTSAAGRLFDGLASILGLCDIATRQAEAPVLLEQCAENDYTFRYRIDAENRGISVCSFLQGILDDMERGIPIGTISAKIHNGLAHLILEKCKLLLQQTNSTKVVISGGCFQNKRLVEHLQILFSKENIPLYIPSRIPCNDGGIAAGQLTIAAARSNSSLLIHHS